MDAGMPILKVREPEKRFSRYTTIAFKRPRPRNNFKHSRKVSVRFTRYLRLHNRASRVPYACVSSVFVVSNRNPFDTNRNPFVRVEVFSDPTRTLLFNPRPTFLWSRSRFKFRSPRRLRSIDDSHSTSHCFVMIENANHLLAREALD